MLEGILQAKIGLQSTNDFNRYRKSASKRVAKLRKQNGIAVRPSKGRSVKPKELSEPEHHLVAVYLSERAWAAAMEAKSALEASSQQGQRKTLLAKLAKAIKYAKLATSVLGSSPETTTLEVAVLKVLAQGDYALETKKWESVVEYLSHAHVGLETLGKASGASIYADYRTTKVDVALRYALMKADPNRNQDISRFSRSAIDRDSQFAKALLAVDAHALDTDRQTPGEILGDVKWRNHSAKVNDADLAQAIVTARKRDAFLDDKTTYLEPETFDKALLAWQEAHDEIQELISTQGQNSEDQSLHILNTFIQYNLLLRRVQRDTLVASRVPVSSSRDAVRVYDTILQSCGELSELPGVFSDDELSKSISGLKAYFRSKRAATIGQVYQSQSKYAEALALYRLALDVVENADSITVTPFPVSGVDVDTFKKNLRTSLVRAHGLAVIYARAAELQDAKAALSSDQSVFPVGAPEEILQRLADLKGCVQPVPPKPVFYDIAFNYVLYPQEQD